MVETSSRSNGDDDDDDDDDDDNNNSNSWLNVYVRSSEDSKLSIKSTEN
jgi:hypothetical protein